MGEIRVVGIGLEEAGFDVSAWMAVSRHVLQAKGSCDLCLSARPMRIKAPLAPALVVAGSVNYTGAALLAGEAAYRVVLGW